jgi:hypothetical protein
MGTAPNYLTGIPVRLARELGNAGATAVGNGTSQTGATQLTATWSGTSGFNAWNLNPNSGNTAYVMDSNAPVGYTLMVFNPQSTTALVYPEANAQRCKQLILNRPERHGAVLEACSSDLGRDQDCLIARAVRHQPECSGAYGSRHLLLPRAHSQTQGGPPRHEVPGL